jgi:hypothetical protein
MKGREENSRAINAFRMNSDFTNLLEVIGYFIVGMAVIVLLGAWILKKLGPKE